MGQRRFRACVASVPSLLLLLLFLLPTPPADAEAQKIFMVGHSHIDLAWKWNYAEATGVAHNTFRDVMDLMDHYESDRLPGNPLYYSQSQAQAYEWMETLYPDLFERIRSWTERGQWEPVGGMWVESDTNLPSGESLVRQVLYGKLYFLEHLGVDVRVGWLPDTFGYSASLPQIFKKAGIDTFACTKITWNDTHKPTKHMFHWRSPDGSKVLTYLSLGPYDDIPLASRIDELSARLAELQPEIPFYLFYMGIGDHGGGVFQIFVDNALQLQRRGYPIVFSRSEDFFRDLDAEGVSDVIDDEMYLEFHRGTYTSRAKVKERNRRGEIEAETLEKAAAAAVPYGGVYPREDLDAIWKKILLNQFHDVLPGSAIDLVYEDFDRDHDFVDSRSGELLTSALGTIGSRVNTAAGPARGEPLLVFNALSWARSGPVAIPMTAEEARGLGVVDAGGAPAASQFSALDGALLFRAEDVPSLGYKTYTLAPGVASGDAGELSASPTRLENAFLVASISPASGLVTSLRDKRAANREVIQPGTEANLLQVYQEGYDPYPAWDLAHKKYENEPAKVDVPAKLELVESGPLRAVFRATYGYKEISFEQEIEMWAGIPRVDFRFHVENWGSVLNRLLKVAFPLNLVNQAKQATYDVPYAALTRTHDGTIANWEASGQKWVNVQENGTSDDYGVALLSTNKYGFDLANDGPGEGLSDGRANILRMTLLKSSQQPLPGALGLSFGGPVTDKGSFESAYALYPHRGPWEDAGVVQAGYEINYPLTVQRIGRHEGKLPPSQSFLQVSPSTVIATVLKQPERPEKQNELVVRLFETARKSTRVRVVFPTKRILGAKEVDLLERDEDDGRPVAIDAEGLSLDVGHDEIVTVRLEYEETTGSSTGPATGGGDRCGCSTLDPAAPEGAVAFYGIVHWMLLLLVPRGFKKLRGNER